MAGTLNVRERLDAILDRILSEGRSFHGNSLRGLRPLFAVEGDSRAGRITAPYWIGVLQGGRGVRKTTQTTWTDVSGVQMSRFQMAIYDWMSKRGMFKSQTDRGRLNEAKSLAYYINKYGNMHYRSGQYIDVYDTIIKDSAAQIHKEISDHAFSITSEAVKL